MNVTDCLLALVGAASRNEAVRVSVKITGIDEVSPLMAGNAMTALEAATSIRNIDDIMNNVNLNVVFFIEKA